MTTQERFRIVCCRTTGPINLGMILRTCCNLGLDDLHLIDPRCPLDCDDSRKFAVAVRDRLTTLPVHTDLARAITDCDLVIGTSARPRDEARGAPLSLPALCHQLTTSPARRIAVVFGNEQDGLNDDELAHCQLYVRLATPGHHHSYNLAQAVAIIGHALATLDLDQSPATEPLASQRDRERLLSYWLDTLDRFRYFRRTPRARFTPQLRAMLNRFPVSRADCEHLRGMLAQFNYIQFGDKFP